MMRNLALVWVGIAVAATGCGSSDSASFGAGDDDDGLPAEREGYDPTDWETSSSESASGDSSAMMGDLDLATPTAEGGAEGGDGEGGNGGAPTWPADPLVLPEPTQLEPNQLTAGIWDDNANYSFFERYQASRVAAQGTQLDGAMPIDPQAQDDAQAAAEQERTPKDLLDVALVVDTTGSMGDELAYLKVEFLALHETIVERYPNSEQRWALVVYRDEGDAYLTRSFDFTTSASDYQSDLAAQSHDGGGDYPEAPDAALAEAADLSWRTDRTAARLLFWVADAPHHADRASEMLAAVESVKAAGVHVYPVASSGVADLAELTMRQTAQLTHGRYLFLTDDSGIGGSHAEPTIPCYFVRLLSTSVLRVVDVEMTGDVPEQNLDEVIRIGGAIDQDGYCIYGAEQEYRPF